MWAGENVLDGEGCVGATEIVLFDFLKGMIYYFPFN